MPRYLDIADKCEEAEAKGKVEGKAEGKTEMITNMHSAGAPMEQMCQFSGFTQEEVEKILSGKSAQ